MEKLSKQLFISSVLLAVAATALPGFALAADKLDLSPSDAKLRPFSGPVEITPTHLSAAVPPKSVSKNLIDQISKVKEEAPFRHGMHMLAGQSGSGL
jgi:hypothetical protein